MTPKIFDCFIFNDEIDILHQRISQYMGLVDGFLIAESKISFDGKPKPLFAKEYLNSNPHIAEMVQLIEYEFPSDLKEANQNDRWGRERYARQSLSLPISFLPDDAFVILSDVDEFPSVSQINNAISKDFISSAPTPVVIGKINLFSESDAQWNTVRIGPKRFFEDLNEIRYMRAPQVQGKPGIHLTWLFGNFDEFLRKVHTTAHSEYDRDPKLVEDILEFSQKYQVSHLGRFHRKGYGLLKFIPRQLLSEIQISLLESRPDWYATTPVRELRWKRFCASYLVTCAWATNSSPTENRITIHTFVLSCIDFLVVQISKYRNIIFRKVKKIHKLRISFS